MQVLHSEVVDQSMPLIALIILIAVTLIIAIMIWKGIDKLAGVLMFIAFSSVWLLIYSTYKVDIEEYKKAIVEDWNIVHSEGWEVIKQEGEITVLKRKLEEKQ